VQDLDKEITCSRVCCARSVVDIITPAANEPNSRLRPNLSLHCIIENDKDFENCTLFRTKIALLKKCSPAYSIKKISYFSQKQKQQKLTQANSKQNATAASWYSSFVCVKCRVARALLLTAD
jgi:hypothetical protein